MKGLQKYGKTGFLALALAAVMALVACGSSSAPSQGAASGEAAPLRVGMECAYPPFNWTQVTDENNAVALDNGTFAGGYDVEIAKRIAETLGRELVIVKTEWDGLPPSLTSDKVDIVIAGMTNTKARRATLDFSDNYYTSDLVIVVQSDGPYSSATSLADFAGTKVTGQLGTIHYDVIDQIPDVQKQQAMKDFPTMVAALSSGTIDSYVSERPAAKSAAAANPKLTFIEFAPGAGFDFDGADVSVAIALKKGNAELQSQINEALAKISETEREQMMVDALTTQPLAE